MSINFCNSSSGRSIRSGSTCNDKEAEIDMENICGSKKLTKGFQTEVSPRCSSTEKHVYHILHIHLVAGVYNYNIGILTYIHTYMHI